MVLPSNVRCVAKRSKCLDDVILVVPQDEGDEIDAVAVVGEQA
jgi:hypothetical protein